MELILWLLTQKTNKQNIKSKSQQSKRVKERSTVTSVYDE